jgi:CDP-glucose 4,6-dehydratase
LSRLQATVYGVSIDIPSEPSHFNSINLDEKIHDYRLDIRDSDSLKEIFYEVQPDFVFHLAAQALVRLSYNNPIETITSNAIGSANVMEALRSLEKPIVAVMITSDKVYDNVEWAWGYRETDRLGGQDPYSASKGMAELAIRTYVESFFKMKDSKVRIGVARAGNVIGGGDWALDRIVPDCMKSWSKNKSVDIRNPAATRPWQHVLEPLSGYLTLGAHLCNKKSGQGQAYNFGPSVNQNHSVSELIGEMEKHWDSVLWKDTSQSQQYLHEAGLLKLSCDKALFDLNWQPTLCFEETVRMTVEWYKNFYEAGSDAMYDYSVAQVTEYTDLAKDRKIVWA